MLKKVFLFLLVVFAVIQFFHPDKNINSKPGEIENDISNVIALPSNVQIILQTSCYDCHSNNTEYPWYAEIQPVAWWLNHHIEEGKREINFNEFASYRLRRQYKKLEEITAQIKNDKMPLSSYTFIHKNAILSKEQKLLLTSWANGAMDTMKTKYPLDSLTRKKDN